MEKKLLTKGSFVEVKSDDEGFKGAWYVATVVGSPSRSPSKKYRLLIEYETLFQDDDGSKPLREIVDMSHVRPVPPMSKSNQSFELNEVVDAFYRDGWWAGVITKVHEESRYSVFFENPPEETEFDSSDLRPHNEWVDGNWIRAQKQVLRNIRSLSLSLSPNVLIESVLFIFLGLWVGSSSVLYNVYYLFNILNSYIVYSL